MLSLDVELVGESVMVSVVPGARNHDCYVDGILVLGLASEVAMWAFFSQGKKIRQACTAVASLETPTCKCCCTVESKA